MGHTGPSVGKKKEVSKVCQPRKGWADGRNSFSKLCFARLRLVRNYRGE
jgi:hypothetical protein